MIFGWYSDEHLILFGYLSEAMEMAQRYGIQERLPGFQSLWHMRGLAAAVQWMLRLKVLLAQSQSNALRRSLA